MNPYPQKPFTSWQLQQQRPYNRPFPMHFDDTLTQLQKMNLLMKLFELLQENFISMQEYMDAVTKFIEAEYDKNEEIFQDLKATVDTFNARLESAEKISNDASTIANTLNDKINVTAQKLETLIIESGTSDAELIDARTDTNTGETSPTIGKRIDDINFKIEKVVNVKGYELSSLTRTANRGGIVVFESDDARTGDWENLMPIFRDVGIPITLAIIARNIGWPGFMTQAQIDYCVNVLGWEPASHSWMHPNDVRIMTDEEVEQEYKGSRDRLIELGYDCQTYSVPNGRFNTRERIEAKKWYRAARCSDYGVDGLNHAPFESHELKTIWMDESFGTGIDFDYYKRHIDAAVAQGALLIISTHGYLVTTPEYKALVKQVAEYARDNARVMTLKDALNEMGNIVDVGDYTRTFVDDVDRAPKGQHFVVGFDGTVASTIDTDLAQIEQQRNDDLAQYVQQRKDDYKKYVESVSGGTNTVIYDDKGNASVMVAIPRFNLSDVIDGAPDTPHPAFIVRGEVKDVIYVSKYLNTVIDGRAVSLPNVAPKTNITYGTAQMVCVDKGTGWHLMTIAEWAAIALWCKKNGTLPNGNNNYGKDINKSFQRAAEATKDGDNTATTLTGTGHVSWSHDGTVNGIMDLNGNVSEWVEGLKIVDGRIIHTENNNYYHETRENEWIETNDYFDNHGGSGNLVINSARNNSGSAQRAFSAFNAVSGHTASETLKHLAIIPHDETSIDDLVYATLTGERMVIRGGNYAAGDFAGVFSLSLSQLRTAQMHSIGFRSVYIP